jgi:hypothetical protein
MLAAVAGDVGQIFGLQQPGPVDQLRLQHPEGASQGGRPPRPREPGSRLRIVAWRWWLCGLAGARMLGLHISEIFEQESVDEQMSASAAAEKEPMGSVVKEMDEPPGRGPLQGEQESEQEVPQSGSAAKVEPGDHADEDGCQRREGASKVRIQGQQGKEAADDPADQPGDDGPIREAADPLVGGRPPRD